MPKQDVVFIKEMLYNFILKHAHVDHMYVVYCLTHSERVKHKHKLDKRVIASFVKKTLQDIPFHVVLNHPALTAKQKHDVQFLMENRSIGEYMKKGRWNIQTIFRDNPQPAEILEEVVIHKDVFLANPSEWDVMTKPLQTHALNIWTRTIEQTKEFVLKCKQTIQNVIQIMKTIPKTKETFTVYAGMKVMTQHFAVSSDIEDQYEILMTSIQPGDIFAEQTFAAFSVNPFWAVHDNDKTPCCLFRLTLTPADPYLVLNTNLLEEMNEILIPPAQFRVVDVFFIESLVSALNRIKVVDLVFH